MPFVPTQYGIHLSNPVLSQYIQSVIITFTGAYSAGVTVCQGESSSSTTASVYSGQTMNISSPYNGYITELIVKSTDLIVVTGICFYPVN